jgi:hypothetical protein
VGSPGRVSAIVAILHATLAVPPRIKDWTDISHVFATLRTDLETFRYRMETNPQFPPDEYINTFEEFRKRLANEVARRKNDILLTSRLENKAQDRVNERLRDKIASENGR